VGRRSQLGLQIAWTIKEFRLAQRLFSHYYHIFVGKFTNILGYVQQEFLHWSNIHPKLIPTFKNFFPHRFTYL